MPAEQAPGLTSGCPQPEASAPRLHVTVMASDRRHSDADSLSGPGELACATVNLPVNLTPGSGPTAPAQEGRAVTVRA